MSASVFEVPPEFVVVTTGVPSVGPSTDSTVVVGPEVVVVVEDPDVGLLGFGLGIVGLVWQLPVVGEPELAQTVDPLGAPVSLLVTVLLVPFAVVLLVVVVSEVTAPLVTTTT
jgi:hypothetical protein